MPFGITNVTAPNLTQIIDIVNETDYTAVMSNVNHTVYGGYLYFALLIVAWIILYFAANERNNQVLQNLFFSGFVVSLVSLFMRAIEISQSGLAQGLLTDRQMWIFPVITALLGLILWMTKRQQSG